MIKSSVTARDSENPVSLRINYSVVTAKTSFFLRPSYYMLDTVLGGGVGKGGMLHIHDFS